MRSPNTRNRQFLAAGAGFVVLLGATSCAQTGQAGSVETHGPCMPSEQTYEMSAGNMIKYGIKDLSHDKKLSTRVYTEDFIGVQAVGTGYSIDSFNLRVDEVVFSDEERQGAEIKRIGANNKGLAYYEDLDTHRVDVGAVSEDGYEFAIREADKEVVVTVARMDEESGTVRVTFTQDCNRLPEIN